MNQSARLIALLTGCMLLPAATPPAAAQPPTTGYRVYDPNITRAFVYNPQDGELRYNHDASLVWFKGRFIASWNGNTNPWEGREGQKNYWATSDDGETWSEPIAFDDVPVFGNPSWQTEWQPNLFAYSDDELWCTWTKSGGFILSRMTDPDQGWSHEVIYENYEHEGRKYFLFPSQNPTRLTDGSVVAPMILREQFADRDSQPTAVAPFRTTDGGRTWHVPEGSIVRNPRYTRNNPELIWEPMYEVQADGNVRLFARNENRSAPLTEKLITAVGRPDASRFGPPTFVALPTLISRVWLGHDATRWYMLHHDSVGAFFAFDRNNIALFVSPDGTDNYTPGIPIVDDEHQIAYPQALMRDDKLHVIYTSGGSPRAIKVATIDPLPNPDAHYVYPRAADRAMTLDDNARIKPGSLRIAAGDQCLLAFGGAGDAPGAEARGIAFWLKAGPGLAGEVFGVGPAGDRLGLKVDADGSLTVERSATSHPTGLRLRPDAWQLVSLRGDPATGRVTVALNANEAVVPVEPVARWVGAVVAHPAGKATLSLSDAYLLSFDDTPLGLIQHAGQAFGFPVAPTGAIAPAPPLAETHPEDLAARPQSFTGRLDPDLDPGEIEFYARHDRFRSTAVNQVGTNAVTLVGWARTRPDAQGILVNALDAGSERGFALRTGWFDQMIVRIKDQRIDLRDYKRPQDNTYVFIAVIIDGDAGTLHFWENGRLVKSEKTFESGTDLSSDAPIGFGVSQDYQSNAKMMNPFYGAIRSFAVFDRALPPDEIAAIEAAPLRAPRVLESLKPLTQIDSRRAADPTLFGVQDRPLGIKPRLVEPASDQLLAIRGNGSAAVDLPAFDPAREGLKILLPFHLERAPDSPRQVLLTLGADRPVRVFIDRASPDVLSVGVGESTHTTTLDIAYGSLNELTLTVRPDEVVLQTIAGRAAVPVDGIDPRLFLGDGFPESFTSPRDEVRIDLNRLAVDKLETTQ